MTLLLVEHDLDFVMGASDRVIVMYERPRDRAGHARRSAERRRVVDAYLGDDGVTRQLLEVDGLEAGYGDALVLRGVSLRAGRDEIVS